MKLAFYFSFAAARRNPKVIHLMQTFPLCLRTFKYHLPSTLTKTHVASFQRDPTMAAAQHHHKHSARAQVPCDRCRMVLVVVWLQSFLLQHSSGFIVRNNRVCSTAPDGTASMTATFMSTTSAPPSKRYWDTPQLNVPEKFLRAIREEPWRGMFEPCVDHPLTEIEIEGEVPVGLVGTLFRNGKLYFSFVRLILLALYS